MWKLKLYKNNIQNIVTFFERDFFKRKLGVYYVNALPVEIGVLVLSHCAGKVVFSNKEKPYICKKDFEDFVNTFFENPSSTNDILKFIQE